MKATNFFLIAIILIKSSSVYGQEEQTQTVKRITVSDIYIQIASLSQQDQGGTLTDFKALAPGSDLLNKDLTEYSGGGFHHTTTSPVFSMMLGIKFGDKQKQAHKTNPQLRLGIIYFRTSLSNYLSKDERSRYDTLTSNQTGQTFFIDSVTSTSYSMNYTSEQLRFDGSLVFRTQRRLSLYAGIGVTAGMSINAKTEIYFDSTETEESIYSHSGGYISPSYYSETEKYTNKNNFGFSAYIPMGIDFRMGKKREFWKQIHLFYELRPGVNVTSIAELRTYTNASIQQGLGLRINWI